MTAGPIRTACDRVPRGESHPHSTRQRPGRVAAAMCRTLAACLALTLAACGSGEEARRPPNVVVVVLDTLRPDRLGCYGHPRPTSPNLDKLAPEFFLFENAQSGAPWTAPALITLFTSLYPDAHAVTAYPDPGRLSDRAVVLAELLRDKGYATAAITEGGYARGQFGLDRGFDVYLDEGGPATPTTFAAIHRRLEPNIDLALDWIGERGEDPFFLFLHTFEVHSPRIAPTDYLRAFRPDFDEAEYRRDVLAALDAWNERRELTVESARLIRLESVASEFEGMPFPQDAALLRERARELGQPIDKEHAADYPEVVEWVRDLYDAEILYADGQLQRLWAALAAANLWEDTVIVLVSDHGEGLGDHGRIGHGGVLYEELMRILLMIRVPGAELAPRRVPEVVRSVDVMPTLLELAGIEPTGLGLQGESLVPLMRGEPFERAAFGHALNSNRGRDIQHSIRVANWRLIHDSDSGRTELYDLSADPKETVDVAEREPERTRRLLERLEVQRKVDAAVQATLGGAGLPQGLDPRVRQELIGLGYISDED